MIVKLIYSIFFITSWYYIIKYRKVVKSWTGNFYWAEHYLWNWWTYFVLLLIWLGLIFLWVTYPFWVFDWYQANIPKR